MEEALLLQDLETLAGALNVEIRYDDLDRRGGLCRYAGKACLILQQGLSVPERIDLLARALARFPLDDVFIRPHVRELLEKQGAAEPRTTPRHREEPDGARGTCDR